MSYDQNLADILAALESIGGAPAATNTAAFIGTWSYEDGDVVPFTVVSKPMDLDMPTVKKFWRRLEFFGEGRVKAIVYGDGHLFTTGTAQMTSNPTGHRFVNLPRGAKGYALNVVLSVMGRLDGFVIHYDAVGVDEKNG